MVKRSTEMRRPLPDEFDDFGGLASLQTPRLTHSKPHTPPQARPSSDERRRRTHTKSLPALPFYGRTSSCDQQQQAFLRKGKCHFGTSQIWGLMKVAREPLAVVVVAAVDF